MSESTKENTCCDSENHKNHLCSLLCRDMDKLEQEAVEELTKDAAYRCQVCNRMAKKPENLCDPMKM